jgi:hypothetical protein
MLGERTTVSWIPRLIQLAAVDLLLWRFNHGHRTSGGAPHIIPCQFLMFFSYEIFWAGGSRMGSKGNVVRELTVKPRLPPQL